MNPGNFYKLSTREDPWHLHKGLGIVCFLHFVYRYARLGSTGSMELQNPVGIAAILLHGVLSVSSLIFHIPKDRNPVAPMIYPEFRLHSIVFALRSVACCLTYAMELPDEVRIALCFLTMVAADVVTARHRNETSGRTISNMPFDPSLRGTEAITHMYSRLQIGATLFMLGGMDGAFSPLLSIQLAAFFMTLVRKGILTSTGWHVGYTATLWINVLLYLRAFSTPFLVIQLGLYNLYTMGLFPLRTNKYFNWAFLFSLYSLYRAFCPEFTFGAYDISVRYGSIVAALGSFAYKLRGLRIDRAKDASASLSQLDTDDDASL